MDREAESFIHASNQWCYKQKIELCGSTPPERKTDALRVLSRAMDGCGDSISAEIHADLGL